MYYDDFISLYELLGKYEDYVIDCKNKETNKNVLNVIDTELKAIETITSTIALEF